MKKYFVLFLIIISSVQLYAQGIQFDVFGNLRYESVDRQYTANLKKDILDNHIFSDNNDNELRIMKRYLDLYYGEFTLNEGFMIDFFRQLITACNNKSGYRASYDVDIFDNVKFEDNQNNSMEIGRDIFGDLTYKENGNGVTTTIGKNLSGDMEYRSDNERALLKKDIFNNWLYSDSSGNNFEISNATWQMLSDLHGNEEKVLLFLIGNFLP